MRDVSRSRSRVVYTFAVIVVGLGASFAACANYLRSNGEQCLKGTDCTSGYCVQQLCASAPTFLPGDEYPDAGSDGAAPAGDSGGSETSTTPPSDASDDGDGPAGPTDAGHDTGTSLVDSGPDAQGSEDAGPDADLDADVADSPADSSSE